MRGEIKKDTAFISSKEESHTTVLNGFMNIKFNNTMNGISSKISHKVK